MSAKWMGISHDGMGQQINNSLQAGLLCRFCKLQRRVITYISYIMEMTSRRVACVASGTSQFKRFSNLDSTKSY